MARIVYLPLDKNINAKETILTGWDAVEAAIYLLLTTNMNSLPEIPSMGFDIQEFLFRVPDTSIVTSLENELRHKISVVTNNSEVTCSVTIENEIADIVINYYRDATEYQLGVVISKDKTGVKIEFKDIVVV